MHTKLPTDSVDILVHIVAADTQVNDPQANFISAQRIVCHRMCYAKMTVRGAVRTGRRARLRELCKSHVQGTGRTGATRCVPVRFSALWGRIQRRSEHCVYEPGAICDALIGSTSRQPRVSRRGDDLQCYLSHVGRASYPFPVTGRRTRFLVDHDELPLNVWPPPEPPTQIRHRRHKIAAENDSPLTAA